MKIEFSPKKQFQESNDACRELLTVVGSGNFQKALSASLSEYVHKNLPTADQLRAVNVFIDTLLKLPTTEEPMPLYPVKQLDHEAYDARVTGQLRPTATATTGPRRHD